MRFTTRVLLGVTSAILLAIGSFGAFSAAAQPVRGTILHQDSSDQEASVAIPYKGTVTKQLPDGWVAKTCPAAGTRSPNFVTVTCPPPQGSGNGTVTFTANDYSPSIGTQKVTIAFTFNGTDQTFVYSVTLSKPQLQAPAPITYNFPVTQGQQATIPFSDLGYQCEACSTTGPTFLTPPSGSVKPSSAGVISFDGTGLIFAPSPDFSGTAELSYRLRDTYGQQTPLTKITVTVLAGTSHAPAITNDSAEVGKDGVAKGNVLKNDIPESKKYTAVVNSCGKPANGQVSCSPDGSFLYTPNKGFTGIDQFSYHTYTKASGDQSTGSVIVGVGKDPAPVLKLQQADSMISQMTPPQKVADGDKPAAGVLSTMQKALSGITGWQPSPPPN